MSVTAPISTIDCSKPHQNSWSNQGLTDRIAAHIGVALLDWADSRAARATLSHDENRQARRAQEAVLRREIEAQRLTQRIGF